jgi:uncharacterized protein YjbJ (UPF0337 family)
MDAHKITGDWTIAKGQLKKWADLTDGDFHDAGGKLDELAGGI